MNPERPKLKDRIKLPRLPMPRAARSANSS